MLRRLLAVLAAAALALVAIGASPASAGFRSRNYTGVGNKVIKVNLTQNGILTAAHAGTGRFALWSLNPAGQKVDLLVHVVGTYQGTVAAVPGRGSMRTAALQVIADGRWSLAVKPSTSARAWRKASVSGTGNQVLKIMNRKVNLRATHRGSATFVIWALDAKGAKIARLVNKSGNYSGRKVMPRATRYLAIETAVGARWRVASR